MNGIGNLVKEAGIDLAAQALSELDRKLQRKVQRTVMNRHPNDLAFVVLGQHRDAEQLLPAKGLRLPLEVVALTVWPPRA